MIYVLDLFDELRTGRLSDHGGDIATTAGLLYKWQDKDYPVLNWTNPDLARYFNWALMEMGKREPLFESTSSITFIPLVADTAEYKISPYIMSIEEARIDSTGRPLIKDTRKIKQNDVLFGEYYTGTDWRAEDDEAPTHYIDDVDHGKIRVWKTPTQADTLRLVTKSRNNYCFEWTTALQNEGTLATQITGDYKIDEMREALLAGAASRAFLKRGEDTYDPNVAREFELEFDSYVGPKVDLRTLNARRRNAGRLIQLKAYPYAPKIRRNRSFYGETTDADGDV